MAGFDGVDGAGEGEDGVAVAGVLLGGLQPPSTHVHPGPGWTVVHPVDGAVGAAGGVVPGGYQPPPMQTQPAPGFTVVHPVGSGAGANVAGDCPTGGVMPGGYQPPAAQVHPGPGFTVVQPADEAVGVGAEAAAGLASGSGMSGGYQPPLTQTHSGPGRTVVHWLDCAASGSPALPMPAALALARSVVATRIVFSLNSLLLAVVDECGNARGEGVPETVGL